MPDVEDLDDVTLITLWKAAKDHDNPSEYEQSIREEMQRRQIDV